MQANMCIAIATSLWGASGALWPIFEEPTELLTDLIDDGRQRPGYRGRLKAAPMVGKRDAEVITAKRTKAKTGIGFTFVHSGDGEGFASSDNLEVAIAFVMQQSSKLVGLHL